MNTIKHLTSYLILLASFALTSCVDTPIPSGSMLPEQVDKMEAAEERLLSGIVAFVNDFSTWSSSDLYYTQDWGYPCQMFYREVLGSDIPVAGGAYNYWVNVEKNTSLKGAANYTYYYYYKFVRNCNNLIARIDPATASEKSRHHLGCALAFRALCYMDLARLFEFQPTGITSLDDEATSLDIWGLTVPIVTDKTPDSQMSNNPRVTFATMYRFILSDLNLAEQMLQGYNRPAGNYPDLSVVYGLQARLWLEMATRFELSRTEQQSAQSLADLKTQLALEGTDDGYADLEIGTAESLSAVDASDKDALDAVRKTFTNKCYAKAADYAVKARAGYKPTTEAEWTDSIKGFNTATDAWMLFSRVSEQEQEANYFSTLLGTVCTEATWGMAQYGGGNYRCIGDWLYNCIADSDWRKQSWLAPADADAAKEAIKATDKDERAALFAPLKGKYHISVSDTIISKFPAYANFKFRARSTSDMIEGLKCDIPLMRMEEMYFIEAEAVAHTQSVASGAAVLKQFVNDYRYTDGSYKCTTKSLDDFTTELLKQKRIEFWGEGICYFDYKRLHIAVRRGDNNNYLTGMTANSKADYVCPAMNYYILNSEINNNPAVKRNPDCKNWPNKK